ncbi:MAG: hypothetical protein EAZ37_10315 [Burkholderiales bacterium]|nr:MAG: hypothetical protein EAZ37_10315 [Burkholderiales bacterium]
MHSCSSSLSDLTDRFKAIELYLLGLAVAILMMACGGGVSGGGTGGSLPVSSSRGPVNGLGSIIVAGIEFDDPIRRTEAEDGAKLTSSDLTLGVQVAVIGESQTLEPKSINRVKSIIIQRRFMGTLIVKDQQGQMHLSINGQRILMDRRSIVVGKRAVKEFAGQKVLVSGYLEPYRNDIIATRIESAPAAISADKVYVTARVLAVDSSAKLASLGFTTVAYAQATGSGSAIQAGEIIRFEGTATAGSTTGVIATAWRQVGSKAPQGNITLRGVVTSRPTAASPNTPLVVDGYTIPLSQAALTALTDLRRGSTVEVKGQLDQTTILNASVRIIGYPIDPLPGEESVQEPAPQPGAPPYDDYLIKGGTVESVDLADNSFVLRGIRIKMPAGAALPPEVYVGSVISIAGQVRLDQNGLYFESVVTQPDRQWQTPQQISATSHIQDVLINGTGQARIVWIDADSANLQSTLYEPSSGLWTPQPTVSLGNATVTESNLGLYLQPSLGLSDGRAMLVYQAANCLYAKPIGVASSEWLTARQVSTDCSGTVITPRVAIDASGNATMAWTELKAGNYRVWASQYDALTQAWSTPLALSTASASFTEVSIARNALGQAVVAWSSQGSPTSATIYSSGNWSTASQVTSATLRGNLTIDSNGNITLIASYPDRIVATRYSAANGTWSPEIDDFADSDGSPIFRSLTAMDATGNVVVVWRSEARKTLYSRKFNSTDGLWGSIQTAATSTASVSLSAMAANSSGQAVLAYYSADNQTIKKFAARYSFANDSWSLPIRQEGIPADTTALLLSNNRVAINEGGAAVMIWRQLDPQNIQRSFANVMR